MVVVLHTPPFQPLDAAVMASGSTVTYVALSETLLAQWPAPLQATIIENGIDLERFRFSPEADADRFALWFGRIVPEKGLHLAIDAARVAGRTALTISSCCPKSSINLDRDDVVRLAARVRTATAAGADIVLVHSLGLTDYPFVRR